MTQTEQSQVTDLKRCLDAGDLEGFEKTFVADMVRRGEDYDLSGKQSETLENIWRKHCEGGRAAVEPDDDDDTD